MMSCFLTILLSLFFQDDSEVDILAASLLSKVNTAGAVRNKVGCLCLGVSVVFYFDWFFPEEEQEPSRGLQNQEGLPRGFRRRSRSGGLRGFPQAKP